MKESRKSIKTQARNTQNTLKLYLKSCTPTHVFSIVANETSAHLDTDADFNQWLVW